MARCRSCRHDGPAPFYRAESVPVHSTLLLDSREEALAFERRDVVLELCPACGFIQNGVFEEGLHDYAERYEETQAYSGRFLGHARRLAAELVERHDLRARTVLEVGCGKGDFLVELARAGAAACTGIDPAAVPGRLGDAAATDAAARGEASGEDTSFPGDRLPLDRIELVVDLFDERQTERSPDLLVCRHTLEHVADVAVFVTLVRKTLEGRGGSFYVDVPAVERILDEGAFWDVYYEHCSYFSLGSLGRLFERCGLTVDRVGHTFEDQYAEIGGGVERAPTHRSPVPDDLARTSERARYFVGRAERGRERWRTRIDRWRAEARRVLLWGSGSKAVAFLSALGPVARVDGVVDVNPHRRGRYMPGVGVPISAPADLPALDPDHVVVMNPAYTEEIRAELDRWGVTPEVHPLGGGAAVAPVGGEERVGG